MTVVICFECLEDTLVILHECDDYERFVLDVSKQTDSDFEF